MANLLILTTLCLLGSRLVHSLTYHCHPNDTLVVENPMPTVYINAFANDSSVTCTINFNTNNTRITITGCSKSDDILLLLSESGDDIIMGGVDDTYHVIRCDELVPEGVNRTVTKHFTPEVIQESVSPTFGMSTTIRENSATGNIIFDALVGTELYWTVDHPVQYSGMPMVCKAFAGTSASGPIKKTLVNDGCSQDFSLVHSFSMDNTVTTDSGQTRRHFTKFFAFRFYSDEFITLMCQFRLCPDSGTDNCNYTCPSGRRKRDVSDMVPPELGQAYTTLHIVTERNTACRINTAISDVILVQLAVATIATLTRGSHLSIP